MRAKYHVLVLSMQSTTLPSRRPARQRASRAAAEAAAEAAAGGSGSDSGRGGGGGRLHRGTSATAAGKVRESEQDGGSDSHDCVKTAFDKGAGAATETTGAAGAGARGVVSAAGEAAAAAGAL